MQLLKPNYNVHNTQPLYKLSYSLPDYKCRDYSLAPANHKMTEEQELNLMSLLYAQKAFETDWDLNDTEENEYWDSFVK